MGGPVIDDHFQAGDREADEAALLEHRLEALLHRGDELGGDGAALDLADELEVAVFQRLHVAGDTAVLPGTTGLLLVGVVELGPLADRLAIGHLRRAGLHLGVVLAPHALHVDLQVEFSHAGNDGLR